MSTLKACTVCKVEKPILAFHKQANGKFGVKGMCIECNKEKYKNQYKQNLSKTHKDYYYANHEANKTYAREWYRTNKDRLAARETEEERKKRRQEAYARNRDVLVERQRSYNSKHKLAIAIRAKLRRANTVTTDEQKANRSRARKIHYEANKAASFEYTVRRKRTIKQQTPAWANFSEMRKIYNSCIEMNKLAGYAKYHVDHVVPLKGLSVTGLHVEHNLRIIEAIENLKKGSKHVNC